MGSLAFIRDVYTLDTLDTRFTSSSAAPYQTSIDARSDPVTRNLPGDKWESKAPRSKWNTQEFYLYYVGSAVMIVGIFMATASVSTRMYTASLWPIILYADFAKLRIPGIPSSRGTSQMAGFPDANSTTPTRNTIPFEKTCPT